MEPNGIWREEWPKENASILMVRSLKAANAIVVFWLLQASNHQNSGIFLCCTASSSIYSQKSHVAYAPPKRFSLWHKIQPYNAIVKFCHPLCSSFPWPVLYLMKCAVCLCTRLHVLSGMSTICSPLLHYSSHCWSYKHTNDMYVHYVHRKQKTNLHTKKTTTT